MPPPPPWQAGPSACNEGTVNGRLDNNLVVEFKAPESLIGQWADVHITGSRAALLVGELAE